MLLFLRGVSRLRRTPSLDTSLATSTYKLDHTRAYLFLYQQHIRLLNTPLLEYKPTKILVLRIWTIRIRVIFFLCKPLFVSSGKTSSYGVTSKSMTTSYAVMSPLRYCLDIIYSVISLIVSTFIRLHTVYLTIRCLYTQQYIIIFFTYDIMRFHISHLAFFNIFGCLYTYFQS